MFHPLASLSLLVLGLLSGCGVESDASFGPNESATAVEAATASYAYDCKCVRGTGPRAGGCYQGWETMSLTLSSTRATVRLAEASQPSSLRYDPTYHPTGNTGYARYAGTYGGMSLAVLVEAALRTGGYALRTGGKGGYAKYTVRGDAYDTQKFICRRR